MVPYGHERRKGVFLLKLRFSEKAKKCEENPTLGFDIYSVTSKPSARIFQILLPSQNILTLLISKIVQLKLADKKLNK